MLHGKTKLVGGRFKANTNFQLIQCTSMWYRVVRTHSNWFASPAASIGFSLNKITQLFFILVKTFTAICFSQSFPPKICNLLVRQSDDYQPNQVQTYTFVSNGFFQIFFSTTKKNQTSREMKLNVYEIKTMRKLLD